MMRLAFALVATLVLACHAAPTTPPVETPAVASGPTAAIDTTQTPAALPEEAPQPVAVRINAEYADAKASRWAARLEHDGREVYDRKDAIVASLGIGPGSRIADVGAGTGLFSVAFAKAVGERGKVWGIDVQPDFVEHIRTRAKGENLPQLIAHRGGARTTGLAPATVDIAFLCDAYHHLEYPRTYLHDLFALIVPGGRLAIIDYDRTRPGTSRWMKDHIRADPDALLAEIRAAGFVEVARPLALDENFFVVFERPRPPQ